MVSGDCIALASQFYSYIEWEELLFDRGLVSEEYEAIVRLWFADGILVSVYRDPEAIKRVRRGFMGLDEEPPDSDEEVEFSYVELGLDEMGVTADQRENPWWLHPGAFNIPERQFVRTFSGDSGGLTPTAQYRGQVIDGTGTAGGFVLRGARPGRDEPWQHVLLTTSDGRAWSEVRLNPDIEYGRLADAAADPCATLWGTDRARAFSTVLDVCPGQAAKTVAVLPGVMLDPNEPKRVSAGPAGLVAVVRPYRGTGAAVQPTHDLWVDLPQESLPPSHRQGAVQPTHDRWVGWSSDGVEWEWQDATEIFGVNDPQLSIQLAVGGDFVLAYVSVSDEPSRWFIAEVPGS